MIRRTLLPLVLLLVVVMIQNFSVLAEPPMPGNSGNTVKDNVPVSISTSTHSEGAGIATPGVSGRLCFQSYRDGNWEIYAINADGTGLDRLTNNPASDTACRWSPDMRRIVFTSDRDGNSEIYTMNANGSDQHRLTYSLAAESYPNWSPDSKKIVYSSDLDGDQEIYVMNSDGTNVTQLTSNSNLDSVPAWSPDGQYISFVSGRDTNDVTTEIYRMDANGGHQTRLTTNTFSEDFPNWSPNSLKIAFSGDPGTSNNRIYSISVTGTNYLTLTTTPFENWSPVYSPDGAFIAFSSNRDGQQEVYLMQADGSMQTNLTNNAGYDRYPHWVKYQDWVVLPLVTKNYYPTFQNLTNGDFESGHLAWSEFSTHAWDIIVTEFPITAPHSGAWAAWLGGDFTDTSSISQTVLIPAAFPNLGYYHWIASADSTCGNDVARVLVNGAIVDQYNLCGSTSTGGWVIHAVNLTSYISQTVSLRIQVSTNGADNSNLFVDDVALYSTGVITSAGVAMIPDPQAARPR